MIRIAILILIFVFALPSAALAAPETIDSAAGSDSTEQDAGPSSSVSSPFVYGFYGMLGGTAIGLSAGYLSYRGESDVGQKVAISSAVGLVGGAVVGLGLGAFDVSRDKSSIGYYAVRDSLYGVGFGGVVGFAAGGIIALGNGDARDALTGLSLGALIGAGAGLAVGIVEGTTRAERAREVGSLRLDVAWLDDGSGTQLLTPTLSGVF